MSDFAHRLRLDQVRDGDRLDLQADEAERNAVAGRLGLSSLSCLEAHECLRRLLASEHRILPFQRDQGSFPLLR